MSTEQVLFFTVPVAGSLAVDTDFPVPQFVAVALAAQAVGFREWNILA